jgi:branched-chain amino acid transport system permease protein
MGGAGEHQITTFLQFLIGGLLIGSVYALIAIGLTLVFGVMGLVNFAHADFLMLGMFGAYLLWRWLSLDPLVSAIIVAVVIFALGALIERVIFEPIINAPPLAQIMATIGLSLILANGAAMVMGTDFLSVTTGYQTSTYHVFGISLNATYLYAALYAAVVVTVLGLFLNKTEFGKAMRATAQNRGAAVLLGINPRRMYMIAFGIGVGLSALAGAVILPYTLVYPSVGQQYILIMFTVVVLGRLGSVLGATIAGLVVGVIQSLTTLVLPAQLQNLVVFVVFFAALVLSASGVQRHLRAIRRRVNDARLNRA